MFFWFLVKLLEHDVHDELDRTSFAMYTIANPICNGQAGLLDTTNCYVPARAKVDEETVSVPRAFMDVTTILTTDVSYAEEMQKRRGWASLHLLHDELQTNKQKCSEVCR